MSALGLETLWTRMFAHLFGGTSLAVVSVLTAYMTGLALGSWWGGRWADRTRYPMQIYGLLEATIGLWGIAMPFWLQTIAPLHQWSSQALPSYGTALLRFALATLVMLVPTAMMGATLPLLSRALTRQREDLSTSVGWLYTVNTAGAVMGCFCTGFVFLPFLGIKATLWTLGGLNLALALVVLGVARRQATPLAISDNGPPIASDSQEPEDKDLDDGLTLSPQRQELRFVLFVFATTGGLAMVCQVCWNRVLSMVIGSSVYAFTIILSTFLLGLTLGSSVGSSLARRLKDPALALVSGLLFTAGFVWLSITQVDQLPLWFLSLAKSSSLTPLGLLMIKAALAALLLLGPTFAMGLLFPLVLRCFVLSDTPIGETVGRVYAYNTLGAIVGSFTSGFVWIPMFSVQGTLIAAVLLYLSLAVGLFFVRSQTSRPWASWFCLSTAGVLLGVTLLATPEWNRSALSLGLFRVAQLQRLSPESLSKKNLLDYQEGLYATVVVEQYNHHILALKVNGKSDASSGVDMPTQLLSGLLPLSMHGKARDVAVIGWGSGVTVGAALQFPVKSVTAIEIEPAVVKASRWFRPWNYKPQSDQRLKLVYDDGRNYLQSHSSRYDVIISEPSNPWISGVSALFTQEFFQLARKRLRQGGILCQWIQLYELSPQSIRVLMRTVSSVFPHVYLFGISYQSKDTLLVASEQPLHPDLNDFHAWFENPRTRSVFLKAGMQEPIDWLPRLLADNQSLRAWVKDAPLNTDDNAWIELRAPLDLVQHATTDGSLVLREALGRSYNRYDRVFQLPPGSTHTRQTPCLRTTAFQGALLLARLRFGAHPQVRNDLRRKPCPNEALDPLFVHAQKTYHEVFHGRTTLETCLRKAGRSGQHLAVVECWNQQAQRPIKLQEIARWAKQVKTAPGPRLLYGLLRYAREEYDTSLRLLAPLLQDPSWSKRDTQLYYVLGQLYRKQKIWPEAVWFTSKGLTNRTQRDPTVPTP